jgi:hypothetical protein
VSSSLFGQGAGLLGECGLQERELSDAVTKPVEVLAMGDLQLLERGSPIAFQKGGAATLTKCTFVAMYAVAFSNTDANKIGKPRSYISSLRADLGNLCQAVPSQDLNRADF